MEINHYLIQAVKSSHKIIQMHLKIKTNLSILFSYS